MVRRVVNIIILFTVIIISLNGITNMCYATTNNEENIEQYEIKKSEEEKFLNTINDTENETRKIKNINKEISDKNYTNKEIIRTKTLNSKDTEYIYNQFGKTQEYKDEEYKGTLTIDDIDVKTIDNGYYEKIDEKVLNFNNYSDNDLNNVEKEIMLNNQKYYLINVEWESENTQNIDGTEVPITYKGKKIYQTVQKIANPNTYKVTVKYLGKVEKIDTIYNYKISYEDVIKEEPKADNNIVPIIIVSGLGLTIILICLLNTKNTYIYSKIDKGFKLIKKDKISDKNVIIDITNCRNKNKDNIYAIKVNLSTFNKLKGRTITIVLGNKKKDIVLWNNYYEIKL